MSNSINTEATDGKNAKKKGLGRGLGSLLGEHTSNLSINSSSVNNNLEAPVAPPVATLPKAPVAPTVAPVTSPVSAPVAAAPLAPAIHDHQRIWIVPIEKLNPNEFQPRQNFEKEKLEDLSRSIKEKGILQPIVARKNKTGNFEIIAGERRWRAAQMAGLKEVPVILKTSTNQESLEFAIIENIQRADLDSIEEAEAYQKLGAEFHLTQQQIADKVGKERATVANSLRLLLLPLEVKNMVRSSEISTGHAKVLLGLSDSQQQKKIAKKIAEEKLSVRATEKLLISLSNLQKAKDGAVAQGLEDKLAKQLAEDLQKKLGTKVSLDYQKGKGKISIYFYSDDELSNIAERLKN